MNLQVCEEITTQRKGALRTVRRGCRSGRYELRNQAYQSEPACDRMFLSRREARHESWKAGEDVRAPCLPLCSSVHSIVP